MGNVFLNSTVTPFSTKIPSHLNLSIYCIAFLTWLVLDAEYFPQVCAFKDGVIVRDGRPSVVVWSTPLGHASDGNCVALPCLLACFLLMG